MIRFARYAVTLLICIFTINAQADNGYKMRIVNHFNQKLYFTIGINPQVIPDLPVQFEIATGDERYGTVKDLGHEAYLRTAIVKEKMPSAKPTSAFWGIEIKDGHLLFHGYLDYSLAYSWSGNTITFCTPDEYKKHHHC